MLYDKSYTINGIQTADNEDICKQWFLNAYTCLCNIEAKPRLKPKQLFSGKYEVQ